MITLGLDLAKAECLECLEASIKEEGWVDVDIFAKDMVRYDTLIASVTEAVMYLETR